MLNRYSGQPSASPYMIALFWLRDFCNHCLQMSDSYLKKNFMESSKNAVLTSTKERQMRYLGRS